MGGIRVIKILGLLGLMFLINGCQKEEFLAPKIPVQKVQKQEAANWEIIHNQYIVVLEKSLEQTSPLRTTANYGERRKIVVEEARTILRLNNVRAVKIDRAYNKVLIGFSAKLTQEEVASLRNEPRVAYIEPDRMVVLGKPPGKGKEDKEPPAEVIPWGISRVGSGDGTGKTAWIIDTGIDLDHPDLNVDVLRSRSFISFGNNSSANDENGHGTHVAGTIAAIDNEIGVVGVAANATAIAIRVLDRRGRGYLSDVIAGIDHVGAFAGTGDVANISLGGGTSQALDDAVINASTLGIMFSIAAGNASANANNYSPARVNGTFIYTVSAMDQNDTWASFSNYGNPPIDFCAPGVAVLSTWKNGEYRTISGTSMAAPHVGGILLLNGNTVNSDGTVVNDPDGNPDLIAHQ